MVTKGNINLITRMPEAEFIHVKNLLLNTNSNKLSLLNFIFGIMFNNKDSNHGKIHFYRIIK